MTIITSSLFSLDCLSLLFCPRNQWMKNTPKNVVRKERDKTAMFAGQDFSSGVKCVVSSLRHDLQESVTSFLFTRHTDKRPFPLLAFFSSGLLWNTRTKSISIKYFKWRRRQTETRSRHSIPSYLLLCLDSRFPSFLPKYIKRERERENLHARNLCEKYLCGFFIQVIREERNSPFTFFLHCSMSFLVQPEGISLVIIMRAKKAKIDSPDSWETEPLFSTPQGGGVQLQKEKEKKSRRNWIRNREVKLEPKFSLFFPCPRKQEEGNHERNRDEDDLGWLLFSFLSSSSLPSSGSVFFAISYQQSLSLWLRLAFLLWDKSRGGEKNTRNHNYFHEDDHRLLHKWM